MIQRIRVVQLICGLAIGEYNGGGELFAIRMGQLLDPERFDVTICALWAYDSPVERAWQRQLQDQSIGIHYCAPFRPQLRLAIKTSFVGGWRLMRTLRPHIVNTHVEFADLVGSALKLTGAIQRMVRTCHNVIEWPFSPSIERKTAYLYPLVAQREVGVSHAAVERLNQNPCARLLNKQAIYIPNAIDPEGIRKQVSGRDMRAELGIPASVPLFGVVGRLSEQKGLPYLIRAMHLVRAALPEARLLIIGNGERRDELHALVAEQGLGDCITFLGPRSDAIDLIASLDVFVSSSLWEGLPTVILEAMLLGTPVVATNIAGSRDLVIEGQTGRLAPPRDMQALAGAMVVAYQQQAESQALADRARQHVEQFSFHSVARAYEQLYGELLGG